MSVALILSRVILRLERLQKQTAQRILLRALPKRTAGPRLVADGQRVKATNSL